MYTWDIVCIHREVCFLLSLACSLSLSIYIYICWSGVDNIPRSASTLARKQIAQLSDNTSVARSLPKSLLSFFFWLWNPILSGSLCIFAFLFVTKNSFSGSSIPKILALARDTETERVSSFVRHFASTLDSPIPSFPNVRKDIRLTLSGPTIVGTMIYTKYSMIVATSGPTNLSPSFQSVDAKECPAKLYVPCHLKVW